MAKSKTIVKKGDNVGKQDTIGSIKKLKSKRASTPTGAVAGGPAKKIQKKKSDKKGRVKGKSELDNPKFANKDFMLEMIEKASSKEETRQAAKLARREAVEQKIKEKEDKKEKEKGAKQAKLEKAKQAVAKKKNKDKAQKQIASKDSAKKRTPKDSGKKDSKRVRFAL